MAHYCLKKEDFDRFVSSVMKTHDFIAPIKPKNDHLKTKFGKIDSAEDIVLKGNTYFPAKGFFFKNEEVIFKFDGDKIINPVVKINPKVFFGVRRCDLNSIRHQDTVFLEENEDPFYKTRREESILIGYHCKEGGEFCFCDSFELKDFYDLMFYDKGKYYAIEVGSDKGKEFIKKFKAMIKPKDNLIKDKDREIKLKKKLERKSPQEFYDHEDWKKIADICISCGACTFLCPNCHCSEFEDKIEFDLKTGERIRKEASCQHKSFTRVAGDHVFRESRLARFKHRIYHQIQYFKEKHGEHFCTGCGRCIEHCPIRIDWVQALNEMRA